MDHQRRRASRRLRDPFPVPLYVPDPKAHAFARMPLLVCALAVTSAAAPQAAPWATPMAESNATWIFGEGLNTGDGPVTLRLRTRLHMDLVDPDLGAVGRALGEDFDRVLNLRRARWLADIGFAEDGLLEGFKVRAQVDFASSEIDWKDLYVRRDALGGLGPFVKASIRGGHFREPMGLEAMTSVSHLPFIERSSATEAFTPGRSRGVQWSGRTERWLTQAGAFRGSGGVPFPDELETERSLTLRAVHQDPSAALCQVGGGLSLRAPGDDGIRFRARPGTRLLPAVADTGPIRASRFLVGSAEALWLGDGSTANIEWFAGFGTDAGPNREDITLTGGHASYATFLMDGAHSWNRERGGYRATDVPNSWHSRDPGNGAVEFVARLGWVELNDGAVRGGRTLDLECGLNWYLQPATRFMVHGILLSADPPGSGHEYGSAVLARIQLQL